MITRIALRVSSALLILLTVFALTRAMVRALPGDPLDSLIAETGTSIPRDELRHEMGLDLPFTRSLLMDVRGALHGDFGRSLVSKRPVTALIAPRVFNSFRLALAGLIFAAALSLALGLPAAAAPASRADRFCSWFGALSMAIPAVWLGPALIAVTAIGLPIFPLGNHVILPAITLALGLSGVWCRLIRTRVREALSLGPAQAARGRGIAEWKIAVKYGLAPVSGTLLGYLGGQLGVLLAGTVVIEVIFNWQGLGTLWVSSVFKRDYPVIEAVSFVAASTTLLGLTLGDWARDRMSPREEKLR